MGTATKYEGTSLDSKTYTVKDSPIRERVIPATVGTGAGVGVGAYLANLLSNVIGIRGVLREIDGDLYGNSTHEIDFWNGEAELRQFRGEPQKFGTMERIFHWGAENPEWGYTAIAILSALTGFGVYKGVKTAISKYRNRKIERETERVKKEFESIQEKIRPITMEEIQEEGSIEDIVMEQ